MDTETKPLWTTTREAMGKTWTVKLCADDTLLQLKGSNCGRTHLLDQWVAINTNLPLETRDETLLHELLHAANFAGLNDLLKEDVIARLTPALYAFLRGFGLWNDFPWPDKDDAQTLP